MKQIFAYNPLYLGIFWVLACVFGRVIPHPYNVTPLIGVSLCAGFFFCRWQALLVSFLGLLLSDFLLAYLYGYSVWGSWSYFSYSALLLIILLGGCFKRLPDFKTLIGCSLLSSLGYWLWTNFGTWYMFLDLYPHTMAGLQACYIAGLPFLRNAVLGDLAWSIAIYSVVVKTIGRQVFQRRLYWGAAG